MQTKLKHRTSITHSFSARARLALCTLTACMVATLALALPTSAWANVLPTDIVLGSSVEDQQLSVGQAPNLDCTYAILTDADGNVFYERSATTATKIASITKIMTAIVAIENSQLTDQVTISQEAADIGESTASLEEGDVLDMESALKALLVPSGNDAAVAIAETIGMALGADEYNAEGKFVELMNQKAAELGCADTLFENPHGLDDDAYEGDLHSTAADVALISRYAMQNELIRSIVGGGSTTIYVNRGGEQTAVDLETTDMMLDLYSYTIGIKTGNTEAAGPCFSGAISRDGKELYAVVLDSTSEEQRFYDCMELFDWFFNHLVSYQLCNTTEYVTASDGRTQTPVVAYVPHGDWVDKTFAATLSDTTAAVEVFDLNGNISQEFNLEEVHGNVKAGDKVGTVTFMQHNEAICTLDVIAAEDCDKPGFFKRIGIWFDRLFRNIKGEAQVAEEVIVNTTPLIVDKSMLS